MCRLYGFRATEPTKVECTLVYAQNALLRQSRADQRGVAHADGWGVAWYDEQGEPVVERRDTAAGEGVHFSLVAERVYATTVVAHVRRATVGSPATENTHPFSCGRWTFAHNGTVSGFDQLAPRLEADAAPALWGRRRGVTDSEAVFLWMLSRMQRAGIATGAMAPDAMARGATVLGDIVGGSAGVLAGWCAEADPRAEPKLNFVLTDGRTLAASRWHNSLHWLIRDGVHDCEICGIPHVEHTPGAPYRAVLVASEPITHEAWREVPDESVLVIDHDLATTVAPIDGAVTRSGPSAR